MTKGKSLFSNVLQFGLTTFISRAIVFLMVPLYTYCLTTEEYGVVDLLNTTVQLVLPFATLQVQDAIFRFSLDNKYRKEDVFTIGIRILGVGTIIFSVLLLIAGQTQIIALNSKYLFYMIFSVASGGFRNISIYFCKGIDKIKSIAISNVGTTLVIVVCNLCFLLLLKWGIYGYLLATCIGNCFGCLWLFFDAKLYRYFTLRVTDRGLIQNIIVFSIPMIFSAISWWANNSLDKYILQYYCDSSAVGLLAAAYKIPAILSLLGSAVSSAYSVSAVKEFDKNDSDGFLGYSYHMISSCYVIICVVLIVMNIPLAKMLFSNDFFAAWEYVPPLICSALFSLLSLCCEQYFVALKKTHIIAVTAVGGAVLNLILNILMIPRFGAYGAAVATCVSFFVAWLSRYLILKHYLHMKNDFGYELISYFLVLITVVIAYFGIQYIVLQLIVFGFILLMNKQCILDILHALHIPRIVRK